MMRSLAVCASALAFCLSALPGQNPSLPGRPTGPGDELPPRPPGVIAPRPAPRSELRIASTQIEARIEGRTATTRIRQVFENPSARVAEADWLLPLAEGATADDFTMTVGGVRMEGDVLDAGRARGVYESIVRRRRDPGLLEFVGRGCLRARVFPIPAQGTVEVEVRIRQLLEETGGLRRWAFPLRGLDAGGLPVESGVLDVTIHSDEPVQTVYSPLAGVEVVRPSPQEARLSVEWSDGQLPGSDLEVFYALQERDFGVEVLSSREKGEDGYFLMTLAPKRDWDDAAIAPRDVRIAIDTSGSMKGPKIEQAKNALRYFVHSLRPADRFEIVEFSTEARPLFGRSVAATEANRARALEKIDQIEARGGTHLEDALRRTLAAAPAEGEEGADAPRPMTVLVTDGKPSIGARRGGELLQVVQTAGGGEHRVFVFGVGNDLNAQLLDRIAAATGGSRDYVREGEDMEVKLSALVDRISYPVMTGLELEVDGADVFAVHPTRLGDLFQGDQVVVYGRYREPGEHAIRLAGTVHGTRREYVYEASFAAEDDRHDFLPPLWAERRVAVLLDAMRLGEGDDAELRAEIERLGREFGIVTPYTSHLILEEGDRQRLFGTAPSPGGGGGRAGSGPTGPSAPAGPATGGPGSGGPAGPRGPTTGGGGRYRGPGDLVPPNSGADDFFMGAGRRRDGGDPARFDRFVEELVRAGALPAGTDPEAARATLDRVARELYESQQRLQGLGGNQSGQAGVDASVYLQRLIDGRAQGTALASLFTRRVGGKVFRLRAGRWEDLAWKRPAAADGEPGGTQPEPAPEPDPESGPSAPEPRQIVAFGDEWFALSQTRPDLAPCLAFSTSLVLVDGDDVIEIVPPADEPAEAGEPVETGDQRAAGEPGRDR